MAQIYRLGCITHLVNLITKCQRTIRQSIFFDNKINFLQIVKEEIEENLKMFKIRSLINRTSFYSALFQRFK